MLNLKLKIIILLGSLHALPPSLCQCITKLF